MPEINVTKDPIAQPGKHTMVLASVSLVITKNPYAKTEGGEPDEDAERERLIWEFVSTTTNEHEEHVVHKVWTGPNYGSPRATLTKFLDLLVPGMDEDKARHFNTDSLLYRGYEVKLRAVKGKKAGTTYIEIADIEPVDEATQMALDADETMPRAIAEAAAAAAAEKANETPV